VQTLNPAQSINQLTCYVHLAGCVLLVSELTSIEELVEQLRVTYQKVVEGEGSALIGAKSIVTTAVHFYHNNGHLNVPVCALFSLAIYVYL